MSKPNEIKKLKGTLRKDRVKSNPMSSRIAMIDEVDESVFLNEYSYEEYKRCFIELSESKVIQTTDITSLIMLCDMWGLYCDMKDSIRNKNYNVKTPNGLEQTSMNLSNYFRAYAEYSKVCKEFGLTPVARTKIEITTKKPSDNIGGLL
jgi:P27 family predicted phage terminase small subunit